MIEAKLQEVPYDFYEWNNPNGPKERIGSYAEDMTEFMLNRTDFGLYCHEGRDLLSDFMAATNLKLSWDDIDLLRFYSNEIVLRYEESMCEFCNQGNEGEDNE